MAFKKELNVPALSRAEKSSIQALIRSSSNEARASLNYDQACNLKALPVGLLKSGGQEIVTVAVSSDSDPKIVSDLKFITGRDIRVSYFPPEVINEAIFRAYRGDEVALKEKLTKVTANFSVQSMTPLGHIEFDPQTGDVAKLVASLIEYALSKDATDLHIIPRVDGILFRLRIDGELYSYNNSAFTLQIQSQLISRLKVLAGLDITLKTIPQDGAFTIPLSTRLAYARLSIMPTVHGEKAVLRFLGGAGLTTIERLGLDQTTKDFFQDALNACRGALIFSGPTGSGKTSTMYALLNELAQKNLGLVSIEDPVEQYLEGVSQTSINPKIGLDYTTCLRSVLRQDPDGILLGEMRDEASAKIAYQAALTGHILLTTVHARDVFEVLLRLRNLGLDPLTIAQGTALITCQRLIPTLCPSCKVIDLNQTNHFGRTVHRQVGCAQCDYSGHSGRALAIELLAIDRILSKEIAQGDISFNSDHPLIGTHNYRSLRASVQRLVLKGLVSFSYLEQFN